MENLSLADMVAERAALRVPACGCCFTVKLAGRVKEVEAWGYKPEDSFLLFRLDDGSVVYIDLTISEIAKLRLALDGLEESYGLHSPGFLHYLMQGTKPFCL